MSMYLSNTDLQPTGFEPGEFIEIPTPVPLPAPPPEIGEGSDPPDPTDDPTPPFST